MKKRSLIMFAIFSVIAVAVAGVYFTVGAFANTETVNPQPMLPSQMYGNPYNYSYPYGYGMGMGMMGPIMGGMYGYNNYSYYGGYGMGMGIMPMGMMGMMNPYYANVYNYTYPEGYMDRYPMYGTYNNTYSGYYNGYGMGVMPMGMMGMGMMRMNPYYNVAYNYTYGPYGMGMGMMGMGMMPYYITDGTYNSTYYGMYGGGMNPYWYGMNGTSPYMNYPYVANNTAYPGYYGGCGMGMGYPYAMNPYSTNNMSPMPSPSAMPIVEEEPIIVNSRMIYLSEDPELGSSGSASVNASIWNSPFLVAGLGIGFLAFAPVTWKLLHFKLKI